MSTNYVEQPVQGSETMLTSSVSGHLYRPASTLATEDPSAGNVLCKLTDQKKIDEMDGIFPADDLLLKDLHKLTVRVHDYKVSERGTLPRQRSIQEYLRNGFINLDKPANPSSHEVVSWVKRIIPGLEKTGHSGTLDPKVTGCLIVCLDRATKLVKSQQGAGKEYIAVIRFHDEVPGGELAFTQVLETMCGALFQRPPLISAVKRQLRIRTIYGAKMLEFDLERKLACFWISCEAGTYIRTLCFHIGLILGAGAHMQELRRVRSGVMTENKDIYTLHDVLEAQTLMRKTGDESRLRQVVQPMEALLVGMPRIMIKDSAVSAICHGGQLMLVGIIAFDANILPGMEAVIMTCKGEAVAIAITVMGAPQMAGNTQTDHHIAAKLKRVLLERLAYPKQWGLGPHALEKRKATARTVGKPASRQVMDTLHPSAFVEAMNAPAVASPAEKRKRDATADEEQEHEGKKLRKATDDEREREERKKLRKAEKKATKEGK